MATCVTSAVYKEELLFETDRIDTLALNVITAEDGVNGNLKTEDICKAKFDERDSCGDVEAEKGVFETLTRLVLLRTLVSLKNADLVLLIVIDITINDKVALPLA